MKPGYKQPKTKNGLQIVARQRAHQKREVETSETVIHTGNGGKLILETSLGEKRGVHVCVSISLDEILAWLPHLIGRATVDANSKGFIEGLLEAETEAKKG